MPPALVIYGDAVGLTLGNKSTGGKQDGGAVEEREPAQRSGLAG